MKYYLGLGLFLLFASFSAYAQPNISLTQVATGLDAPIYVTHCGDERLFIVEQAGVIRVKQPGTPTGTYSTFLDISSIVVDGGEKGLLGLAFHPDYKNNGYFFVNYTNNGGGPSGKSVLARYSVDPADSNVALVASGVILDTIHQPYSNHNGGCIQFGHDGYLYMGMGDGGSGNDPGNRALNMALKLGKMLRYDVNNPDPPYYFVPSTNPFVDSTGVRPEIWASGLRNPWRFSFDRLTGDMWIGDVGQNTREEIDFQPANSAGGENYGWRCFEGFIETPTISQVGCPDTSEVVWPVIDFPHSGGDCSITGGYVYRGSEINGLYGHYLSTDYCSGKIRMLTQNTDGSFFSTQLLDAAGMTSFGEDVHGEIYVCLSTSVSKITSPDCEPVAVILSDSVAVACPGSSVTLNAVEGPGLSYQWLQNGIALVGDTTSSITLTDTASYSVVVTNDQGCSTESNVVNVVSEIEPVNATILPIDAACHGSFGTIIEATPAGGTFSGTNIDANGFFNAVAASYGTQTVYYTYVDSAACNAVVNDTTTFEYVAPVDIQMTVPYFGDSVLICAEGSMFDATPAGGVFSATVGTFTGNLFESSPGVSTTISYTYIDSNGCTNVESVDVFSDVCGGIEPSQFKSFNVYPNPTEDNITLSINPSTKPLTLHVMNCTGQIVMQSALPTGVQSYNVSLKDLADGVYILRLYNEDGTSYAKAVKASVK